MHGDNVSRWPLCVVTGRGPRIGVDIDGVIRDLHNKLVDVLLEKWPNAILVNKEAWRFVERYSGVPNEVEEYLFVEKAETLFMGAPVFVGAQKFILDLRDAVRPYDGRVLYVTKQGVASGNATIKWLAKHKFPLRELQLIPTRESKASAECDILIDDNLTNLRDQETAYGGAICVKQDWNNSWKNTRFETFEEIVEETKKTLKKYDELKRKFNSLYTDVEQGAIILKAQRERN